MATKARHKKTAIQLWVADNRKAGGYSSADLAAWTGVTTDTARGWESRGRPGEDAIAILERKFGKPAPGGEDRSLGDQSDLAAAIRENTAMLERVLTALMDRLPPSSPQPPDAVLGEWSEAERRLATERAGSGSLPRKPSRGRRGADRATESQGA
jgi:hypothetical protein